MQQTEPPVSESAESPQPNVIVVPTVVVPVVVPVPVPVPVPQPGKGTSASDSEFSEEAEMPPPEELLTEIPQARPPGALALFWRKYGGTGFVFSAVFHFALLVGALFWVISEWQTPKREETHFVSGSGGSSAARGPAKGFAEKVLRRKPKEDSEKILSKGKNAMLALPPMPEVKSFRNLGLEKIEMSGIAEYGTDFSGNSGFGGGLGHGHGIGIGDGKNHLGKFKTLLGAKVEAQRIAVYLDCSGSMKSYLPAVKAEIYEKFPDADIFAYAGAGTEVADGDIVGGRAMKAKQLSAIKRKRSADETEVAKLSAMGKSLHKRYSDHFSAGTAGAWLDIFLRERYDALVVFSDFRDGIRQRRDGKTVFADSSYSPKDDERNARERAWESDWLRDFSKKGAPKLYLFSAKAEPQNFLKECVEASGGTVTILSLKKSTRKKE